LNFFITIFFFQFALGHCEYIPLDSITIYIYFGRLCHQEEFHMILGVVPILLTTLDRETGNDWVLPQSAKGMLPAEIEPVIAIA
jgi:hypothetical protein